MNLQDIIDKNNEQKEILISLEMFIKQVKIAKDDAENIYDWLFMEGLKSSLGNYNEVIQNKYRIFREKLISIDAYYLGSTITKLKSIYDNKIISNFLDEIEINYKEVFRIKNLTTVSDMISNFRGCYNALNTITTNCNNILLLISYLNSINLDLSHGINDVPFKIRFFKEDNTIESLIENAKLLNNLYNAVNRLIGKEEEELKYCRIESGTLELLLIGFVPTLVALKPLLELAYKVYSEQFSKKSKLELQEKEIKIRGDYLKLLKDVSESKNLSGFNIQEDTGILQAIADIDCNIKELYSKNPFIKINDSKLGSEELKDTKIPINYLESSDDKIEILKELENVNP